MVTCVRCGVTAADPPPLTWSTSVEQRGDTRAVVYVCDRCSREHVRAIEGRLDQEWW